MSQKLASTKKEDIIIINAELLSVCKDLVTQVKSLRSEISFLKDKTIFLENKITSLDKKIEQTTPDFNFDSDKVCVKIEHTIDKFLTQKLQKEPATSPRILPQSPRFTKNKLSQNELVENLTEFTEQTSDYIQTIQKVFDQKSDKNEYFNMIFSELYREVGQAFTSVRFINLYNILSKGGNMDDIPKQVLQNLKNCKDYSTFYLIDTNNSIFSSNITVYIYTG